jgi:hypothetical protein
MPCKTATIPAPAQPDIQRPSIDNISTSVNEVNVEYSLTNNGNATGTKAVSITMDVGETGSTDASRQKNIEVPANSTESRNVTFSLDLQKDTSARVCVE